MKFRRDAVAEGSETTQTREEVRELAEALSLYRSAMHHLAEREAAKPLRSLAERRTARTFRMQLVVVPALAAAMGAAVIVPVYSHMHRSSGTPANAAAPQTTPAETVASMDDTTLMNQIDSEVSEGVPDALRPLVDVSDESTAKGANTEKKNVTQE